MSTNGRKGTRSSIPARGGPRRSNTAPPPAVRQAAAETDPISTSRPRNEGPGGIPVLDKPPADIVAAAKAAHAPEPEPTAKTPPVVVAPVQVPPARDPVPTLVSRPESARSPLVEDEPVMSQPAPSVGPRSMTGAPGAVRRKGRGSNLKPSTGRSAPPPAMSAPKPAGPASEPPISSRATVPAPIVEEATKPEPAPVSAAPQSDLDQHQHFFDSGHEPQRDDADLDAFDERMAHKNSPEARARREKNWLYVRWTAGICVGLMAIGLIKSSGHRADEPEPLPVVSVPAQKAAPPAPTAAAAATVPTAEAIEPAGPAGSGLVPVASAVASVGPIPTASTDDLPAAPGAPSAGPAGSAKFQEPVVALGTAAKAQGTDPATTAPIPVAIPAEPTETERKSAAQEKRSCQAFLEQGALAKAVEAGERSVALDPADGEAWLTLGAAYQMMGRAAEARRSFSSCVAEAKRGPIGECRAMLR